MAGKVEEYMRNISRITVTLDTPMSEVMRIIVEQNATAIIVTNPNRELQGIITGTDTLREMAKNMDSTVLWDEPAENVMTPRPISVQKGTLMVDAHDLMFRRDIHNLIVTKGFEPIGLIIQVDVERWWVTEHKGRAR